MAEWINSVHDRQAKAPMILIQRQESKHVQPQPTHTHIKTS